MKGHDSQKIRVGLDGHTTVTCACGQAWDLGIGPDPWTDGVKVATRHALNPNVGDPRRNVSDDIPFDAIERGPIVSAWLAETGTAGSRGAPPSPKRGRQASP